MAATGPSCSQSLLNKAGQKPLSWDRRPHPHRVLSTRAPCQGWRASPPRRPCVASDPCRGPGAPRTLGPA